MPPRSAPRDLRASDSDRERVVAMLGEALADGRLSHEEYSERMPLALTARTLGDLAGLTADLAAPEHQPVQLDGGRPVTALFTRRTGAAAGWCPAPMTCVAAFGEVVLDFTEAILQDRHVVVTVYALFGRVRLIVPAGVEVVMNGNNILGRQRGGTAQAGAHVVGRPGDRGPRLRGRERGARPHPAAPPPLAARPWRKSIS